jgi:pyrophosphatase PpaX
MSRIPDLPKPPGAALFDLDGTLIGTKGLYIEAYRRAVEPFVRDGLTGDEIRALKPTSELAFIRAIVEPHHLDACLEAFYSAYRDLHDARFDGVYEGIPEVLEALRAAGTPMGLVTGKSRRSWDITSAVVQLGPFDVLVFDDDVRAPKPDPHGLELALAELEVTPADAVYVGDTISDARAARAAGILPITALWARDPDDRADLAERAEAEGATLAATPSDLRSLLGLDPGRTGP